MKKQKPPAIRTLAWLIVAAIVAFLAWASQARLDEVSIAHGEVVPRGQIKTIQHLEGGIIEQMYVDEGDRVAKGDPLVRLDLSASKTEEGQLQVILAGLVLKKARLQAEANDSQPDFPDEVEERRPRAAANEMNTFRARREELASTLKGLQEEVNQRSFEVRELNAEQASLRNQLSLARENFAIADDLIQDGLVSKLDHLAAETKVEELQGELKTIAESIPAAQSSLEQAREHMHETRLAFQSNALEELAEVELAIERTREELSKASAMSDRTLIASPIDGVVKSLKFHTIGAVVRPGEAIMDIVPSDDKLVVEARLDPRDIGYVEAGQPATVKISTYDYIRYGGLDGEVILVSPDSNQDEDGNTFFRVIAETDRAYLGTEPGDLPITAGMQATLDIHTGTQTVIHYLIEPVLKLRYESFRER